jgi:hypothetical protein
LQESSISNDGDTWQHQASSSSRGSQCSTNSHRSLICKHARPLLVAANVMPHSVHFTAHVMHSSTLHCRPSFLSCTDPSVMQVRVHRKPRQQLAAGSMLDMPCVAHTLLPTCHQGRYNC